jgi:hypothetical protein
MAQRRKRAQVEIESKTLTSYGNFQLGCQLAPPYHGGGERQPQGGSGEGGGECGVRLELVIHDARERLGVGSGRV